MAAVTHGGRAGEREGEREVDEEGLEGEGEERQVAEAMTSSSRR